MGLSQKSCGGQYHHNLSCTNRLIPLPIVLRAHRRRSVLDQFRVPVSAVDLREVRHPLAIAAQAEHLGTEWSPFRTPRPAHQRHPGLFRGASALASITMMARADDILPSRGSTARARYNVIEVEL